MFLRVRPAIALWHMPISLRFEFPLIQSTICRLAVSKFYRSIQNNYMIIKTEENVKWNRTFSDVKYPEKTGSTATSVPGENKKLCASVQAGDAGIQTTDPPVRID